MHPRSFLALVPLAACVIPVACSELGSPPRVFVSRVPEGTRVSREEGDVMHLTRWELERRPGLTRGYHVVRSEREWRDLWPNVDSDRIPLLPHGIDFGSEWLLVAAPKDEDALDVRIQKVIDTPESGIHVYVTRQLPGERCPESEDKERAVPVDLARMPVPRQRELHFHVETQRDDPCEPPPEAKIGCRPNGASGSFETHVSVEAGKSVACLSQGKPGARPTVDHTWSFRSVPSGAMSKMTIAPGGRGVSFGTDAFGTYAIQLEVADDLGRTGRGVCDVDVAAPKDRLTVQMLWTKFDPGDDPSTFPRVELHVVGEQPPPAAEVAKYGSFAQRATPWILVKGDCTVASDTPPAWCRPKVIGATSVEELMTDAYPEFRVGVRYADERVEGQPVLCVRTFRGAQAGEWCDKSTRQAGNWWDVAQVEAMTGKPRAPAAMPAPAASASAKAATPATPAPASSARPVSKP